jgi:hypothetical protein
VHNSVPIQQTTRKNPCGCIAKTDLIKDNIICFL